MPKPPSDSIDKAELYGELAVQLRELLGKEPDLVANAANLAALIYHGLPEINWAGFYFLRDAELVVGPFQGIPTVARQRVNKGVCGAAVRHGETVLVDDLQTYQGAVISDPESRSELVVPLLESRECLGVLDLQSPQAARFDEEDKEGCEALVGVFLAHQRAFAAEPAAAAGRRRSRSG